ncbi:MAG: hypothetical protein ABGY24_08430 [bacterium]
MHWRGLGCLQRCCSRREVAQSLERGEGAGAASDALSWSGPEGRTCTTNRQASTPWCDAAAAAAAADDVMGDAPPV